MICHKICMHMRDLVNLHALFACVHTNLAPVLSSIYTDHTCNLLQFVEYFFVIDSHCTCN